MRLQRRPRLAVLGLVGLSTILVGRPVRAQVAEADVERSQSPGETNAYHQFVLGRYLEGQGDLDGALEAYRRASDLDPESAEILAEIAGLHARQNRATDALEVGEAALRLDPDNVEAHRVLATIFSALADSRVQGQGTTAEATRRDYVTRAIEHLEGARADPVYNGRLEFTLGRLYVRAGQYEKAIPLLRRFVEEVPGPSEGVLILARAEASAGRTDEAVRTLKSALDDDPEFHRGLRALARIYEEADRWNEAADTYVDAIRLNPRSVELKREGASALLNVGRTIEARDLLREAVEQRPSDAGTLYLLSQVERRASDFDAAEATAHRLMELDPEDLRGTYALIQVFQQRGEPRRVVEALAPREELADPKSGALGFKAALLTQLGFAYLELRQHESAIETFERVRVMTPADPAVDAYLIRAQIAAGRHSTAIDMARRARGLHPSDLRLIRLEAEALHESGNTAAGISLLEEAVRSQVDVPDAHLALAALLAEAGRSDEAIDVLESADHKFAGSSAIPFQLGAVLERERRFEEAERAFHEALSRDPKHAPTLNYLGYLLAERGERLEEAVGYIQRALEVDPQNGAYVDSLGWAYFKLDRLDLAEIHLLRAGQQLSDNSVVQDHVGQLFFKLGRFDEAIAAWQRSLRGDGEAIERREIESKIERARDEANRK